MESAPRKRGRPQVIKMEKRIPGIIKAQIVPEPDTQEHACNICPRTFETLTRLKRHKTFHDWKPHAHKNGDFECYDCGNFFKSKFIMERHQLIIHYCYDNNY